MIVNNSAKLPEPDSAAKARSGQLTEQIKYSIVDNNGRISFSAFMQQALYTPVLGYYSNGLQKFGPSGDFITAPEVSPLFAQCLAGQVTEIFSQMDNPCLLEFGAGSGVLAVELLSALEKHNALPEYYYILELSAALQQRQKRQVAEKIPHLSARVVWLDQLPLQPLNAVVIANEVLDAMPVERFAITHGEMQTQGVTISDGHLVADFVAPETQALQVKQTIEQHCGQALPSNYHSEYNPAILAWLQALSASLASAVVLLIDYGYHASEYYHSDRVDGTLMCYYRHRTHGNALWYPGLQDITAFVDFSDVAYSALEADFSVAGYTSQAAFLLANGLSELHAEQVSDDVQQQIRLSQQIKTLILPSEMGERFKVMALTKKFDAPLCGFALQDYRNRL